MMFKKWALVMSAIFLLSACSSPNGNNQSLESPAPAAPSPQEDENLSYSVIAEQLQIPWSIQFSGEEAYISEREGHIVSVIEEVTKRLPVNTKQAVKAVGEGGFLGIVLDPDFTDNRQAYAYHSYDKEGQTFNRVILIKQQLESWEEVKALIEDIPGSNVHNGGRMAWGPDGKLYITTGDAGKGEMAQDPGSLGGKILRMNPDGSIPEDNPSADSYVYSLGHRNSQGLAWSEDGTMYNAEHGPSGTPGGHDEINEIRKGENYGWPTVIGDEEAEGTVRPLYHTGEKAIAPSGIAFEQDDQLLVAGLRGEALFRYHVQDNRLETVLDGVGRIRDVHLHNDSIYIITNNTDGRGSPSEQDDRLLLLK
ncbi:PQQ-dependent sugar dehydrogenase [Paenibacillus lemnae]|uniref:Quinoprotein glucose dehydrogenase n=1 Tax=Paenibacillus lemnae TaxID=1330551 RepID=A0A848M9C3_PAELE|nr:PQQ-dependent sugar dehydrogenase [Paenibacillus lemnae]NMO97818.1 quinoprotein glucose dehydrogenase [Paenibacillus lemnae]